MTERAKTSPAFRAFMGELIDYAGLFPPAGLTRPEALGEYARLAGEPEAWMLGRFVVPASSLNALEAELDGRAALSARPLRLTVILEAGADEASAQRLAEQMRAVRSLTARNPGRVVAEALEGRIPPGILAGGEAVRLRRHLEVVRMAQAGAWLSAVPVFLEPVSSGARDDAVVEGMAEARGQSGPGGIGLKLRCGGVKPSDVPPPERLAGVIWACANRALPMKFTAGLHHALRRSGRPAGAANHGFLNVFGAGILAAARHITPTEILECLLDDSPASFRFEADRFSWRGHSADTAEIAAARRSFVTGFGSCSFDEPRNALRVLGLVA